MKSAAICLGLALAAAGCTQATDQSGGTKTSKSEASADNGTSDPNTGDAESTPANPPQPIGAFLADCANVGSDGFACVLNDAATKQKIASHFDSLVITIAYTDQTSAVPALTLAPPSNAWSVFFPVPAAKLHKIGSLQIALSLGGQALPSQTVAANAIGKQPTPVAGLASGVNFIFVTSDTYQPGNGSFSDWSTISSACAKIGAASTTIPQAGKLTWSALMSLEAADSGSTSPNIATYTGTLSAPVVNTAGQVVATDAKQLWGTHSAPIVTDENGAYIGGDALVWTGSDTAGMLLAGSTCSSWTRGTGTAAVGNASSPSQWLNDGTPLSCAATAHIYCLGTR